MSSHTLQCCSVLTVFIYTAHSSRSMSMYYDDDSSFDGDSPKFNLRSSDFAEIVTTSSYIDKSMYIERFVKDHGIMVITAPNHFGKSTNLNMLKKFLEIEMDDNGNRKSNTTNMREPVRDTDNYFLFVDNKLKISENQTFMDRHFGKHPVIFVDFEFDNIHVMSYDVAVDQIKYTIHRSFVEHHYLKNSKRLNNDEKIIVKNWCSTVEYSKMSENDVTESLRVLSRFLYRHYENRHVYVLIDSFDSPALNAVLFALTEDIMGGIYRLISSIILRVLQKNPHAHRGLISGVSYIAGSPALYSLGYITVCRFLENHTYVGFHGFTKAETTELFARDIFNLSTNLVNRAEAHYGGYQSCGNVTMYNPWSVIHLLLTKEVANYWKGPGIVFKLETLMRIPALRKEIDYLSKFQERKVRLKKIYAPDDVIRLRDVILKPEWHEELPYTDLVLTFLLEMGYLTYVPTDQSFLGKKRVKIPNKEVRKEISERIKFYTKHYAAMNSYQRHR